MARSTPLSSVVVPDPIVDAHRITTAGPHDVRQLALQRLQRERGPALARGRR
ncbi:hypothetical protein OHA72_57575 [Dactylosporangium sp. NBC_01737]|uniref:hypothetical protein n=1 Tax=Dactylosporangium sp. NBC_01737 TaxID=2975959 RepID=UPI002E14B65D|nr:hypothetical protein OHA72_57575 [Dactylosporangium sp. NBC_01737]